MADYTPRLKTQYTDVARAALKEEFAYKNDMMIPKLDKIVLNMGVGETVNDTKKIRSAVADMASIAGQQPVITKAKKSGGNYDVQGEIEIRGLKQMVSFNLSQSEKSFDGTLTVDRTKHEVMYGWTVENAMLSNNFDLKFHIELE